MMDARIESGHDDREHRGSSGLSQASTPMMSDSFMIRSSSPSSLISVPDHLPNSTRSPALMSIGTSFPASSRPPGPTATTWPSWGFSLALSGMMIPPLVFSSASIRLTTTRSCSGRNLVLDMTVPLGGSVQDHLPSKAAQDTNLFDAPMAPG